MAWTSSHCGRLSRTTSRTRRARRPHWRCSPSWSEYSTASLDLGELTELARAWERGVDELAAEDSEVAEYVASLEQMQDATELPEASGDAIAAEFERYLRRRKG